MSICLNNIGDILFELGRLDEAFSFQKEALGICESIDNIKVGFHGHNHLQLAFANTLVAIEKNVDIVDSTIWGMGKGPGNLPTELLLGYYDYDLKHFRESFQHIPSWMWI